MEDNASYACGECFLHYHDEARAQECESWCRQHQSCNLEITRHSIERSRGSSGNGEGIPKPTDPDQPQ